MRIFKLSLVVTFFTLCISVTACNTMKGIGQDTEAVGEKIEETAKKKGAEES